MIYTIVKAKSGLHAGATWRFDKPLLTLGASSNADVFLCDPEVPEILVSLRRFGRKIRVDGLHQDARLKSADERDVDKVLLPSQTVLLDYRHIQLEIQVLASTYNLGGALTDRFASLLFGVLRVLRNLGAKAFVALLFLVGLILTVTIVFFGTAGVVKSEARVNTPAPIQATILRDPPPMGTIEKRMADSVGVELQQFAQRSKSVAFDVKVEDDTVSVAAEVSRFQALDLERELIRLARDYGKQVAIKASLKLTEEQKVVDGIEIERVVLGSRPALVLRDGSRLYTGGIYNGLSVVSVDARKVVLKGSDLYEVSL